MVLLGHGGGVPPRLSASFEKWIESDFADHGSDAKTVVLQAGHDSGDVV
jgi:hypothetical protein